MKHQAIPLSIAALLCAPPLLAQPETPNKPMQSKPMQDMSMQNMPGMKGMMQSGDAEGVGVVQAVDPDQGTITIKHQAIESIHWPAMTMTFKTAKPEVLQNVKAGEHIRFGLHTEGMNGTVTWIKPDAQ